MKLSHAYIVSGPPEPAENEAARLAAALLCSSERIRPCGVCRDCVKLSRGSHPDLITIRRQSDSAGKPKREIYVEQVREIVDSAFILPNEAERKVYLIREADAMNPSAQNALLKLLEEPPDFVALILLCANAGALLETVRSRCACVRAGGCDERSPGPDALDNAGSFIRAAAKHDDIGMLRLCNKLGELAPAQAAEFTDAALALCTDMLSGRRDAEGMSEPALLDIAQLLLRAGDYLRSNVGVKHVFGLLCVRTTDLK